MHIGRESRQALLLGPGDLRSTKGSLLINSQKEKPFQCHVCQKCFTRSDVRARHLRMHQGKKEDEGNDIAEPVSPANGRRSGSANRGAPSTAPYPLPSSSTVRSNGQDRTTSSSAGNPALESPSRYDSQQTNGQGMDYASQRHFYSTYPSQPGGFPQPPSTGVADYLPSSIPGYLNGPYPANPGSYPIANGYAHDRYVPNLGPTDFRSPNPQYQQPSYPTATASRGTDSETDMSSAFSRVNRRWESRVSSIKDQTESNVRASGIQNFSGMGQSSTGQYASNTYMQTNTQMAQAPGGNSEDDLYKWLQVNQDHNPVNSILVLGACRSTADPECPQTTPINGQTPCQLDMIPLPEDGSGRYPKVEQSWYKRLSNQGRLMGAEKHWYDIMHVIKGDLFNSQPPTCLKQPDGSRARVSEKCRRRMINAVYPPTTNQYDPASAAYLQGEEQLRHTYDRFPSCADFDAGLQKYFDSFLPEAPFIHMPVFSISTCDPLLLFVMSCIGLGLFKSPEKCQFVKNNFDSIRDRILVELEKNLASSVKDAMSSFATAFVFLKLAALIVDRDHLSPCQLLYISLLNLAQMHGMFSDYGKRTTPGLYESCPSLQERWMAWGRVESLKRISVSLLRLDSAYATFLRRAPVLRVNNIELPLPCDDRLFVAPTAEAWETLVREENLPIVMPAMTPSNSLDKLVGCTYLDYYSLHAVLNYLQVRSLDAYQRLQDFQATQQPGKFVNIPYRFYQTDPSLRNMTVHIVAFVHSYERLLTQYAQPWQRTNCLVFYHFLCLSLTMNQDLFEIAVGREGPKAAANSIHNIAEWSRTSAARRALIHSAMIYQLLTESKSAAMCSLYAAFATFAAALVMTMYVFANPGASTTPTSRPSTASDASSSSSSSSRQMNGQTTTTARPTSATKSTAATTPPPPSSLPPPYELTSPVDWKSFGFTGLDESLDVTDSSSSSPSSSSQQNPSRSAAEQFVLSGTSAYTFQGEILHGFDSAQHVLNKYAVLLKSCGKYNYKDMSRVLFMMSHLLTTAQNQGGTGNGTGSRPGTGNGTGSRPGTVNGAAHSGSVGGSANGQMNGGTARAAQHGNGTYGHGDGRDQSGDGSGGDASHGFGSDLGRANKFAPATPLDVLRGDHVPM